MSPLRLLSALLVTSAVLSVELLVAANSPSPSSSSVATPSPQNGNSGELTQNKTELKAAAKALVESGGPLAYLGMAVSIWGMTAGVDPSGAFRHGQWIAGAVNMKGLDNNFTKCAVGVVGNAAQATCPTRMEEKVFTRWASYFTIFSLGLPLPGFAYTTDAEGFADPFDPELRAARAAGALVIGLALLGIVSAVQFVAHLLTKNEEAAYDEAHEAEIARMKEAGDQDIQNFGPKRCCFSPNWPSIYFPPCPVRYWMGFPYLQIKFAMIFHFGFCVHGMAAIAALEGIGMIMGAVLVVLFGLPVPIIAAVIMRKLTKKDESGTSKIKYQQLESGGWGWRDSSGVFSSSWRKSVLVNRFGATVYHFKYQFRWWIIYRTTMNIIESIIIGGVLPPGRYSVDGASAKPDIAVVVLALVYFIDFLVILLARPYHKCQLVIMEMLQAFHNFMLVLATSLYITDGIMNAQDLLKIETDGVEYMLCVLGAVGSTTWTLFTLLQIVIVYSHACSKFKSGEFWDQESEMERVNNSRSPGSGGAGSDVSHLSSRSTTALPPMLANIRRATQQTEEASAGGEVQMLTNPMERTSTPISQSTTAATSFPNKTPKNPVAVGMTNPSPLAAPAPPPPAAAAPAALPDGWREVTDPKSGKAYYYHAASRKTQWTRPS